MYIQKLKEEALKNRNEVSQSVSDDEKRQFLLSRKWTTRGEQEFSLGEFGTMTEEFWYFPNGTCGATLDNAYMDAKNVADREQRKKDLEDAIRGNERENAQCCCNKCGADMHKRDANGRSNGAYGLVDAYISGGYFSEALSDCTTYEFSLCEECLAELFKTFKNPPKIGVYP